MCKQALLHVPKVQNTFNITSSDPGNTTAITAINNFANDLAARYNAVVGCTRSWDTSDPTDFQVSRLSISL